MAKSIINLPSAAGGLVSPKLSARVDQNKYHSWQRQLQNMIAYKSGGMTRAPGSLFVANCKYANDALNDYAVRLIEFTFSPDTQFIFEVGHHYIRFYSNDQQVNISTAPLWTIGTAYYPGSFVTSPLNGLIYFSIVYSGTPTDPSLNPAQWVQQTILEVYTPYNANAGTGDIFDTDIFKITPCQINDIVYLTNPLFPPYKLTRHSDTDWTFEQVKYNTPALLDQNLSNTTLTPTDLTDTTELTASAPAWTTATYYNIGDSVSYLGILYECLLGHTSSALFTTDLTNGKWEVQTIFLPGHVGSTWELSWLRDSTYVELDGTAAGGFTDGQMVQILCDGDFTVKTFGVWSSDIAVQRSADNGLTWTTVFTITSRSDNNENVPGKSVGLALYKMVVGNSAALISPGATNPRVVFEVSDAYLDGLVLITEYLSAYAVIGQVVNQLYNTPVATPFWSEAAWSEVRGYPRAVTSYQQRMIYASSAYEPQRMWGTVTNDLENFDLGDQTKATDSFVFDLNAPSRGPILWLISQADLFAGFSGAEWVINAGNGAGGGGGALPPSNINAVEQGTYGSAPYVQPLIVGNAVFFTQRQADAIRQMLFSIYTAKYMSQDITALADHLFSSAVVQMAYQSRWRHQGIIWVVVQDGSMQGLTYDLEQEVFGWCERVTGWDTVDNEGNRIQNDKGFESVAVLYAKNTPDDETWVVANRYINGVQTRFIERIIPNNWEETFYVAPTPPAPQLNLAYYVDSGFQLFSPGSLTITGLSHLEGRWVVGLADSTPFGPLLVSSGQITLPSSIPTTVAVVNVGIALPYAGQPMQIDMDPRAGNTQGMNKTISDVYIRVFNSLGGTISNGTENYPKWVSGTLYPYGFKAVSPLTLKAYICQVPGSYTTDPSNNPTGWEEIPDKVWREASPINYPTDTEGNAQLVTDPQDIRVQPPQNATFDTDPVFIVKGNDALPLTVLMLMLKYDEMSSP